MSIDETIIAGCKKGDAGSQQVVFETLAPAMLAICRRYTANIDSAEDVMQEAFITIFTKIKQYQGHGSFEGWAKRIAVNTALMALRKQKRLLNVDDMQLEGEESEPENDGKDPRSIIERAGFTATEMLDFICELPDGFRSVFNLYAVEGYKHREIAKLLGISEGTSKSQLLRARKRFQQILHEKALAKLRASTD